MDLGFSWPVGPLGAFCVLETERTFKIVGGDNLCESQISVLKRGLRRQNLLGRSASTRQHVDTVAQAALARGIGFFGVLKELGQYRTFASGLCKPSDAFADETVKKWLTPVK